MDMIPHKSEIDYFKIELDAYQTNKHHPVCVLGYIIKNVSLLPPICTEVVIPMFHFAVFFPLFSVLSHVAKMEIVIRFKKCHTDKFKKGI